MADVEAVEEGAELPDKRKFDLSNSVSKAPEEEIDSNKRPKVEILAEKNGSLPLSSDENMEKSDEHGIIIAAAEEYDEEDEEDEDDEDDEEDEEDEEDYNAEQDEDGDKEAKIVDRKGKGVVVDGKGKGKMVENFEDEDSDGEDNDNDNDDESSDDSDSDFSDGLDDTDIEDDPLAEVDLNNILPSRTRQRQVQAGVRIIRDPAKGKDA